MLILIGLISSTVLCQENLKTTVISLDLSTPNEKSVNHSGNMKRLVLPNKNLLSFKLENGNPFRYKYILNHRLVKLFSNEHFNPISIDSLRRMIYPKMDSMQEIISDTTKVEMAQIKIKGAILNFSNEVKDYVLMISTEESIDIKKLKSNKIKFSKLYDSILKEILVIDLMENKKTKAQNLRQEKFIKQMEELKPLIQKIYLAKTDNYLLPIDLNGENIDYVEVTLDVFEGENTIPEKYIYKVWISGGVKIDISGGGYITSLFDEDYYLTDNSENGKKYINEKDQGKFDFGFGTMINVSLRGGSWVRPSLNVGALFTSNQKFQLLTGLGFAIGKMERILIHGGLSMGRINTLRSGYKKDRSETYDLGEAGVIPLDEKFRFGHYFGITYNFSGLKKD